ncbi:MAG: acetyl-CoA carboxylase biotin carboxyl carrier protein subunit [Sphingobacteriaceae bacterium]|nr:MAG: acetyl-CoA carboxylase biotin carboxyl carrier protein subunit [Pedobacter sp.]
MFKIKVNDHYQFEAEKRGNISYINSEPVTVDTCYIGENNFHLLYKNKSYRIQVIELNSANKTCIIQVNANKYYLSVSDQFDILLRDLGFDHLNALKISDLKAPMPGLVLKVFFDEGAVVKKGDNLLILEAMKMENSIKAPADLTIKALKIKPGDKVEKNQIMISFE